MKRGVGRRPAWRGRLLLVAAVVLIAVLAWYWRPLKTAAFADASYAARIACSCRHVGGRELSDCGKDLLPGMRPGMRFVMLGEDETSKSVTATVPLMARQTATYSEGWGCVLERYPE